MIGGQRVAIDGGIQRRAGRRFGARQFRFRGRGVPTHGGGDRLNLADGDLDHFVNRFGKRPVQSRSEQLFVRGADRFAETQDDRLFLRRHREDAGTDENNHQHHHDCFDKEKAAAQRIRQRLRTGVLHRYRRLRRGGQLTGPGVVNRIAGKLIAWVAHRKRFLPVVGMERPPSPRPSPPGRAQARCLGDSKAPAAIAAFLRFLATARRTLYGSAL